MENLFQSGTGCTLADAQFFVARCHGFASWPKFAKHLEEFTRAIADTDLRDLFGPSGAEKTTVLRFDRRAGHAQRWLHPVR